MKFTIVIINHNYAEFLDAAIGSALAQTVPSTQVIVVDDGSTDNSRDIIERYGERIVPVLIPAGGHVSAVNAGYAAATGDICIFLDGDDILYPRCIETVGNSWQSGDVKLQYRLDTIDRRGVDQKMPFPHFPTDLDPSEVCRLSFNYGVYPWTVSSGNAFSRDLLDALVPIDSATIYRSPDGYINKMAPLFGPVRSIDAVLGAYRVHGANAWAQDAGTFRIEPVLRWLRFERVLHGKFQEEAARRGIPVRTSDDIWTLQQLEYQLLARRFAPAPRPGRDHSVPRLFWIGVCTAADAPNTTLAGRAIWMMWLFVMAYMPGSVVRAIFGAGRGQMGRTRLSRLLVRLSRHRAQ
jgi:glycosyltransferase involved in cell wall biosynthesis